MNFNIVSSHSVKSFVAACAVINLAYIVTTIWYSELVGGIVNVIVDRCFQWNDNPVAILFSSYIMKLHRLCVTV